MSTVEATLSTMMQRGPEHPGAAHLARRIVKGSAAIAAFPDDPAEHPLVEVGRARNDSRRHFDVTVFPFASVGGIGIPFPSTAILAASKLKSIPHRRAGVEQLAHAKQVECFGVASRVPRGQAFEFSSISCRGPWCWWRLPRPRRSACGLWPFLDILATPSHTVPQIYRTTTPASPFHRRSCTPLCPACHIHLPPQPRQDSPGAGRGR